MTLDPMKQNALVDLVGQPIAERLIANIKEFDEQAIVAGMNFKSMVPPSANEIMAILSNWHVKGSDMPKDMEQTTKTMDEKKKAMDEETTATDSTESTAKAEEMDESSMAMEESEESEMDDEEMDDDISIISESDIERIADAVATKIVESMKGMNGGDYAKTEKSATSLVNLAEAQTEALNQMVKTIKEINGRLESIESVSGAPYRPSQANNNVITQKEVSPNKVELPAGLDPKYRDAYMALMDMNFIR